MKMKWNQEVDGNGQAKAQALKDDIASKGDPRKHAEWLATEGEGRRDLIVAQALNSAIDAMLAEEHPEYSNIADIVILLQEVYGRSLPPRVRGIDVEKFLSLSKVMRRHVMVGALDWGNLGRWYGEGPRVQIEP